MRKFEGEVWQGEQRLRITQRRWFENCCKVMLLRTIFVAVRELHSKIGLSELPDQIQITDFFSHNVLHLYVGILEASGRSMSSCYSFCFASRLAKIQSFITTRQRLSNKLCQVRGFSITRPIFTNDTTRMPEPAAPAHAPAANPDYSDWSNEALISRISTLESQLRARTLEYRTATPSPSSIPAKRDRNRSPSRRAGPFDVSKHNTRPIALKLAYLGGRYNGFEHSNNNFTELPTIEEVLWKALRKSRLISPPLKEGTDSSYDVVWGAERRKRYKKIWAGDTDPKELLDLNWDGCDWSKCGRTDRGVSAFGQVVGVTVRSNRPKSKTKQNGVVIGSMTTTTTRVKYAGANGFAIDSSSEASVELDDGMPPAESEKVDEDIYEKPFDAIADELPYISMLNSILPPDVRILAWCPFPPPDFNARFSCKERRYKYFFTNPAFLPTPGPFGLRNANGTEAQVREGWLDIEAMNVAAKKLEGLHDYRNFCKIDPSKQMTGCERRIIHASIEVAQSQCGPTRFGEGDTDVGSGRVLSSKDERPPTSIAVNAPKVYTFNVHGSAFLWHQVRCMVAVLFLVGQGLEKPEIVDKLLDLEKVPNRPSYEMASDAPLVLWDCIFPDGTSGTEDSLEWIYAGDAQMMPSLTTKSDGRFGLGGVVDELWTQWRKAKIDEVLTGSLLDLTVSHGDGSGMGRGGFRDPTHVGTRSQKIFDGRDTGRMVGDYVSVLEKPKLETLEALNAKWRKRKGAKLQSNDSENLSVDDSDD
jgi:tRNA pseudouridine38/39 synthase